MTVECENGAAVESPDDGQYRVADDESVSTAVVRAVAAASGRSATGIDGATDPLDPLAESVDPDALDRVVEFGFDAASNRVSVAFEYCDYRVTVSGTDAIRVTVERWGELGTE